MEEEPAQAAEGERRPERGDAGEPRTALPPGLESWRRRSAAGAVLTGIAFGFKKALDPEPERPAIVAPAPSGPPDPKALELHLDWDRPEEAWAVVRPWLAAPDRSPGVENGK
jgi:hypothetical protein